MTIVFDPELERKLNFEGLDEAFLQADYPTMGLRRLNSRLPEKKLNKILKSFPETANQEKRLVEYLATTPMPQQRITVLCNKATSIGNLSHVASKANPRLYKHSLFISCQRPAIRPLNKFGELSQMYEWSLYLLPKVGGKAANDDRQGGDSCQT